MRCSISAAIVRVGSSSTCCARLRGGGSSYSSSSSEDSGVGGGLRERGRVMTGGGRGLGFALFFAPGGRPRRFGAGGSGSSWASGSGDASISWASSFSGISSEFISTSSIAIFNQATFFLKSHILENNRKGNW